MVRCCGVTCQEHVPTKTAGSMLIGASSFALAFLHFNRGLQSGEEPQKRRKTIGASAHLLFLQAVADGLKPIPVPLLFTFLPRTEVRGYLCRRNSLVEK